MPLVRFGTDLPRVVAIDCSPLISDLAALGLLILLSACASDCPDCYQEPDIPVSEQALLHGYTVEDYNPFAMAIASVGVIDGKPHHSVGLQPIVLAPGEHEIGALFQKLPASGFGEPEYYPGNFTIVVEPGHAYRIHAGRDERVVRLWVEDIESKEVAGFASVIGAVGEDEIDMDMPEAKQAN